MSLSAFPSPEHPGLAAWTAPLVVGLVLAVAVVFDLVTPLDQARLMLRENGPVETGSAVLHLTAAVIALILWARRRRIFGLLALGSLFMAGREIDLHKAFTTHGLFSTRQYASEAVPLIEKLISAGAVIGLIVAFVLLTRGAWSEIRRLRDRRRPALASLLTLVAAVPVLKLIDGLPRMLREQGVEPASWLTDLLLAVEEIGEMGLPVLTLLILWQLWADRSDGARSIPTLADTRPRP